MKPLELTIKGLNSFRDEQTIDFRRLGEYSIFGIFGPTGSGKSSILDAIILALYGIVPRAGNSAAGIVNQMEDSAEVSFCFELAVPGEGRQEYIIQRRYRRDKNSLDGVRFASGRLARVSSSESVVLASKDTELKNKIVEILGLTAQDFTRAVVLPQGKFAEFLALKGKERTEMLERVFALERFGEELNRSLKVRLDAAASAIQSLESEQTGLGDASNEALALALQELELAGQEAAAAELEEQNTRQEYEEHRRVWETQELLAQVREEIGQLQTQNDEIERIGQMADRARRAEGVRPMLAAAETAENELQMARHENDDAQREEEISGQQYQSLNEELLQAQNEWQEQSPVLSTRLEKLREVVSLEDEREHLRQELLELRASVEAKKEALGELYKKLDLCERKKRQGEAEEIRLRQEREKYRVDPEWRERINDALNQLNLLEKAVQNRKLEEKNLQDKRGDLLKLEQALSDAVKDYDELQAEIRQIEERLDGLKAELQQCMQPEEYSRCLYVLEQFTRVEEALKQYKNKRDELETKKADAGREHDRLSDEWQRGNAERAQQQAILEGLHQSYQQEINRHQAAHLASALVSGEPCPVCGSLHHPLPARAEGDHSNEIQSEIDNRQTILDELDKSLGRIGGNLGALQANLQLQAELLEQTLTHIGEQEELCAGWREKLPDQIKELPPGAAGEWLEGRHSEYEEKNQQYQHWEQVLKIKEKKRGPVLAEREKQAGIRAHSLKSIAEISSRLDTLLKEENELQQRFAEKAGNRDAAALRGEDKNIKLKDKAARSTEEKWQALVGELQKITGELEEYRVLKSQLEQELALGQASVITSEQALTKLDKQINDVTAGRPARAMIEELEHYLRQMEKRLQDCRKLAQESGIRLERAGKRLSAAQARVADNTGRYEKSQASLRQVLADNDFATIGDAQAALTGMEERLAWEQAIREFEDRRRQLAHQEHQLEEQLQGREITREEWDNAVERLAQAGDNKKSALQREGAARNHSTEIKQKNQRWQVLNEEMGIWTEQSRRLQLLQSTLRGKDFVKYIAGEQLRYICQSASLRLQQLSRSRYALELDGDNNFVIRDDHNGGQRRAVTTLSGGETFLASLALALALSAQIQLRGQYPLEFFFLDEGFGTLDPELLETVMGALENLRQERFIVGIISHVPELQNRLPRHLMVIPAIPGGRGTILQLN